MFLREVEGPGMRQNNVVVPCMDVDFLSDDEFDVLFASRVEDATENSMDSKTANEDAPNDAAGVADEDESVDERPSLHPITIDAIEDAFRLRAQNSTTSPLRLIDDRSEWFDVQYSIIKFAERFMEKYTNAEGALQLTVEEQQTIGGRIVGVLMRLDDLEWEWNHRVTTSPLVNEVECHLWKTMVGLHPGNVEQNCIRTVDEALLEDEDFARARAERMLALFLLNIEGPGLEASGESIPGGSSPADFIDDAVQLKLMMPRPRK